MSRENILTKFQRSTRDIKTGLNRLGGVEITDPNHLALMSGIGAVFLRLESFLQHFSKSDYPLATLQEISPFVLTCLRAKTQENRKKFLKTLEEKLISPEVLNRRINRYLFYEKGKHSFYSFRNLSITCTFVS